MTQKLGPESARALADTTAYTLVLWGPTNVGKSTLFNKLTSTRKAIVANRAGVTVDTHSLSFEREDLGTLRIIDSGGVGSGLESHPLKKEIELRAMRALEEANLVLFVVDGTKTSEELKELSRRLRKEAKCPIILVVNKAERNDFSPENFYELGYEKTIPVAAEHSNGIEDLWDSIKDEFSLYKENASPKIAVNNSVELDSAMPRVLILGRPNVGKSTLMNFLSGKNTSAVSEVAGTTRDSLSERALVDENYEVVLTDTAGLRRPGRREREVEWVATHKIIDLSRRADVVVLMLDADEGVTAQDSAIAGFALDSGLGLVIALNKWDLVKENKDTEYKFQEIERSKDLKMTFLTWCPVVRISAKTGLGIKTLKEKISEVIKARSERVQTAKLNSVFESRIKARSGVGTNTGMGSEKLYYMSQVGSNPPEFVVFCNLPADRVHFSFRRYVTNVLREEFGFAGTPIKLHFKES